MNIAFDASRAFNNRSGSGNYSRFVISSLLEHYPENHYTYFTDKTEIDFKENLSSKYKIKGHHYFLPSAINFVWRKFILSKYLKKDQVQIFHGLVNELPSEIEKLKVRKVVSIHDLVFLIYPHLYSFYERVILKKSFFKACERADKIVAVSEKTKEDIISFFKVDPSKVEVVYQDCDPEFQNKLSEERLLKIRKFYRLPKNYILSVGTIEKRKNQLAILKVLKKLDKYPDLHVIFVGKPTEYRLDLEEYIDSQKLRFRVHFLSYIPIEDLPGIYQNSRLTVYPSILEGFGTPVLESLNSGIPVITSKAFSEIGGTAAMYVDPANEEELKHAIEFVLESEATRNSMIEKGLKQALNFRPWNTTKKLMELYKNIV